MDVLDFSAATTDTHTTTQLGARNHLPTSANSTRKRKRTRDSSIFFEFLTFIVCKVANIVIDNNYSRWDSSAESDVSTGILTCLQPKEHNIFENSNTLPDKQVTTFNNSNKRSEMRSRYLALVSNNYNSSAPQLSRQNRPKHSRSLSLLSPTAESTSHSLLSYKSVYTSLASTL